MTSKSKISAAVALGALFLFACILAALQWRPGDSGDLESSAVVPGIQRDRVPEVARNSERMSRASVLVSGSTSIEACAPCHAAIVEDYARSGMSHTWRAASGEIASELTGPSKVRDLSSGYRYQVSVTGEGIKQVETHSDHVDHELRRKARYVVGSGKNALTPVASEHGYLNQMPAAWFRHDEAWGMNPGFELHNHRFSRPISPGCIACHGTAAIHEPPTSNRFQEPIIDGIACQRCHGPTEQHVGFWSATDDGEDSPYAARDEQEASLAGTVHLTSEQSNALCLQCHLQGDVTVYDPDRDPFDFRAGDRLRDHRHDFLVDTGEERTLGIASHGARMLQSRCYTESNGELSCVLCHDPHKPSRDFGTDYYDRKCASCHTPESCEGGGAGQVTGCIACHMPQRASQEGIHLVFTDHAMRRHQPSSDTDSRLPSVLAPNANSVKLVSAWPEVEPDQATLGAAYVLLHETMGPQTSSLTRGAELLSDAIRQDPNDSESRFWLGSALASLGRGEEAIPLLTDILVDQPERHPARFRLAIAYELAGNYGRAVRHYQQLVDTVPGWTDPYPRLAQLYLAQHQPELAVRVLTQQLSHQQDALAYAQLALAKRLQGESHEAAMATVAEALRLNPRLPTAWLHRAALLLLVGQPERAQEDFERVLQFDPENQQARQALQALRAREDP